MTADGLPSILEGKSPEVVFRPILSQAIDRSDVTGSIHDSPRALLPLLAAFAADVLTE
jgi:hypothetical protein